MNDKYESCYVIEFGDLVAAYCKLHGVGESAQTAEAVQNWAENTGAVQGFDDDPFAERKEYIFHDLPNGLDESETTKMAAFGAWIDHDVAAASGVAFRRTHGGDFIVACEDVAAFAEAVESD